MEECLRKRDRAKRAAQTTEQRQASLERARDYRSRYDLRQLMRERPGWKV